MVDHTFIKSSGGWVGRSDGNIDKWRGLSYYKPAKCPTGTLETNRQKPQEENNAHYKLSDIVRSSFRRSDL